MVSVLTGNNYHLGTNNLGNLAYSYDQAGRRAQVTGSFARTGLPLPVSTSAYNANNQLTQWSTAGLTYDANGNMLSDGTNSFTWDARNHLASMNFGANTFQYDPFGRRVAKTVAGTTTNYLYDGVNPVQELSGTTPTANLLSGGIDEVFSRTDSIGTANFLADALGSASALTDSTGAAQTQYTYEPFGNTTSTGGSTNSFQYTGRENDGTGVYFYRARYYSPALQRFITEDPIGFRGGLNLYRYVGNSPLNYVDPFSLTITVNGSQVDYQTAISYLSRDSAIAGIIHDLNASSTNYNINFNNADNDSYDPAMHTVNWDPHSALRCRGGGTQSPALGLGHELSHADEPWYRKLIGWVPWPDYDNLEERRVITGPETHAAHTLGEGTRTDHGGTPYWVPTPTSR